jgi:hypothetical protein
LVQIYYEVAAACLFGDEPVVEAVLGVGVFSFSDRYHKFDATLGQMVEIGI